MLFSSAQKGKKPTPSKSVSTSAQSKNQAPKEYTTDKGYDIKVTVKGLEKGQNAYLGYYFGDKQYLIDTSKVQDGGLVEFKKAKILHGGMYLFVTQDIRYFEFIIDSPQTFSLTTDTAEGMVGNMVVNGSPENEHFFGYLKSLEKFRKEGEKINQMMASATGEKKTKLEAELKAIEEKVKKYQNDFKTNYKNELFVKVLNGNEDVDMTKFPIHADGSFDTTYQFYYYRNHFFDKVDLKDERLLYSPVFSKKMTRYFDELLVQTPDSIIPATDWFIGQIQDAPELFKYTVHTLTSKYEKSEIMGMEKVFVHLGRKYYMSGRANWVDAVSLEKFKERITTLEYNLIGAQGMELNLPDSTDKLQSLYGIKSPITILVFWNPDCSHCQKEIPVLYKLWNGIKDNGVAVYAVNTEFDKAKWTKFIVDQKLKGWTHVHDIKLTTNFRKYYDVYSTPVVYVLDANKKIMAKRIAADQIEGFLKNFYEKENKVWKDSGIDPKTLKSEDHADH